MGIRLLGLGARTALLLVFAIFFIRTGPAAGPRADEERQRADHRASPFSFGSFHNVAQAWKHLDAYSDHLYRRWIANTLDLLPERDRPSPSRSRSTAGYGLALGKFWVEG